MARHDPLTGLPNRRVLNEDLARKLQRGDEAGRSLAIFLIDLDHFKPVNDLHGHDIGDELLIIVADRLRALGIDEGKIYRLGGDEFVCVVDEGDADMLAGFASQIVRTLSEPFEIAGRELRVGATVGVARGPIDGDGPQALLRGADIAMYEAKSAGRGKYRFFHAEMDQRFQERAELEADIRLALETGAIEPYFQPIFDLAQAKVVGFEALARWNHPKRGCIEPDKFIPIVEDLGLIESLTERILRSACNTAVHWPQPVTLAINVTPSQLDGGELPDRIAAALAESGFPAGRLIIEVTENAVIADIDQASKILATLQDAGIRTALDDFGKGYSSLSQLRQLHFDHLKIDNSFIRSMPSSESQKIVGAIAGLGRALGMRVIAEGVETPEIAEYLLDLGCDQGQGFLYGRPMPAEATIELLAHAAPRG